MFTAEWVWLVTWWVDIGSCKQTVLTAHPLVSVIVKPHRDKTVTMSQSLLYFYILNLGIILLLHHARPVSTAAFDGSGNFLVYAQGYSISRVPYQGTGRGQMLIYVPGKCTTPCYLSLKVITYTFIFTQALFKTGINLTGLKPFRINFVSHCNILIEVHIDVCFSDTDPLLRFVLT